MDNAEFELLRGYAQECDRIMKEVLTEFRVDYDRAETIVWDTKVVGVTGDGRAYSYVAELVIRKGTKFIWQDEPIRTLSTKITNEVRGIGKVVLNIKEKDDNYPHFLPPASHQQG